MSEYRRPAPCTLYPVLVLLSIDTCGSSPMSTIGDRDRHPEQRLSRTLHDSQPKDHGTVALARLADGTDPDSLQILGQTGLPGKTYSARLVPAIRELLAANNAAVADLAAIVVTRGPGSFTGIRIALATAKGLAEAHATPILAVSRLAVLAHKAGASAAALDASRHEFYVGDFSGDPASVPLESREQLLTRDAFLIQAAALGPRLAVCESSVLSLAPVATLVPPPTAIDALRYALPRLRARSFDDPVTLDGHYLRRSDAEIFAKPRPIVQP